MRARTQTEDVIRHLEEFGHITSWEAIKEYGAQDRDWETL